MDPVVPTEAVGKRHALPCICEDCGQVLSEPVDHELLFQVGVFVVNFVARSAVFGQESAVDVELDLFGCAKAEKNFEQFGDRARTEPANLVSDVHRRRLAGRGSIRNLCGHREPAPTERHHAG